MTHAHATFTVVTQDGDEPLTKTFRRGADGKLIKSVSANLSRGVAERVRLHPKELADFLPRLKPTQALMWGVFAHESVAVVPDKLARRIRARGNLPVVSRTRKNTAWPEGVAVVMTDWDAPPTGDPLTPDEARDILFGVMPELRGAPYIVTSSAGSHIYDGDKEIIGQHGLRILVFIRDGKDAGRVGTILQHRLWAHGYGYIALSASGAMLERSPTDQFVHTPERLDFAAGALCFDGLSQRRPEPMAVNADAEPIDTLALLPDPTAAEIAEVARLKAAAKEAARPAAEEKRAAWVEKHVDKYAASLTNDAPDRENRIDAKRRSLRKSLDGGTLDGDFEILVIEDGEPVAHSVDFILTNKQRFHSAKTLDPHEPSYDNYRPTGWLNLRAAESYLLSYARGEARYRLRPTSAKPRHDPSDEAREIFVRGVDITGTPAAAYLDTIAAGAATALAGCVRWDANMRAILFPMRDVHDVIVGVHGRHLTEAGAIDPEARKAAPLGLYLIGSPAGVLKLPVQTAFQLVVTESIDDSITAFMAGYTSVATIYELNRARAGAFLSSDITTRFAQQDINPSGHNARVVHNFKNIVRRLRREGFDVAAFKPLANERRRGEGLHALFKKSGVAAVRERIALFFVAPEAIDAGTMTIAEARQKLDGLFTQLFTTFVTWEPTDDEPIPPIHAKKSTVGSGKTHAITVAIVRMIRAMEQARDKRSIVFAAPFHDLGEDVADRLMAEINRVAEKLPGKHITIEIYRGRNAKRGRGATELMCGAYADIEHALDYGSQDVARDVCESCALKSDCAYLAQASKRAQVWFVSHKALTHAVPKPLKANGIAFTVVDESGYMAFLRDEAPLLIPIHRLEGMPVVSRMAGSDSDDVERMAANQRAVRTALIDVIRTGVPGNPVPIYALQEAGLTPKAVSDAMTAERAREIITGPISSRAANRTITPMLRALRAVNISMALNKARGVLETGWLRIALDKDGDKCLAVNERPDWPDSWQAQPLVLADASLEPLLMTAALARCDINFLDPVAVDAPHEHVFQVIGDTFSRSFLGLAQPSKKSGKRINSAVFARRHAELRAWILRKRREHGDEILVVAPKALLPKLRLKKIAGVHTAHFNALAGLDRFKHVRTCIIIGSAIPPVGTVERLAEQVSGDVIKSVGAAFPRRDGWRVFRRANGLVRERISGGELFHPHDVANAILRRLLAEVVDQARGRPRPADRTAAKPIYTYLLNDFTHDIPLAGVIDSDEIFNPDPRDVMLSEGLAFDDDVLAAAAYSNLWPDNDAKNRTLWPSHDAVSRARRASFNPSTRLDGLMEITWRTPSAAGDTTTYHRALFDPATMPDPALWLAKHADAIGDAVAVDIHPPAPADASPWERQWIAAGFYLASYRSAFLAFGSLFESDEALKKAMAMFKLTQQGVGGEFERDWPYIIINGGARSNSPPIKSCVSTGLTIRCRRFRVRLERDRSNWRYGGYDAEIFNTEDALLQRLTEALGDIATLETCDGEPTLDRAWPEPSLEPNPKPKSNLSQTRPWEAEGISRKTWERRRNDTATPAKSKEDATIVLRQSTKPRAAETVIGPLMPTGADMEAEPKPTLTPIPNGFRIEVRDVDGFSRDSFRVTRRRKERLSQMPEAA